VPSARVGAAIAGREAVIRSNGNNPRGYLSSEVIPLHRNAFIVALGKPRAIRSMSLRRDRPREVHRLIGDGRR
jgi:hypothetical protein